MRRGGRLGLIAIALILIGGGIAVWSWRSGETPSSASFGFQDWLVRCQKTADNNVGCGASQQILDRTSGRSIVQLHFGVAPSGKGYQLVVVMPLGVSVPGGAVLEIGDLKRNLAFTQCLPAGCIAPTAVDDALLEKLKSGDGGRVTVIDRTTKPVSIPFSLKGFASAFEKLESQGGLGGAAWWTGLWSGSSSDTK